MYYYIFQTPKSKQKLLRTNPFSGTQDFEVISVYQTMSVSFSLNYLYFNSLHCSIRKLFHIQL